MSEEKLTHWKKNNDSRYISGEDLQYGEVIKKGLRPEMVVKITGFKDSETFDMKEQEKITKTGLILFDLENKVEIYKPVILNAAAAKFCIKEFKSEFLEHWLEKPLILFAKADRRHGYVARFRKYTPKTAPVKVDIKKCKGLLNACKTLKDLGGVWAKMTPNEKKTPEVLALKEKLKTELK